MNGLRLAIIIMVVGPCLGDDRANLSLSIRRGALEEVRAIIEKNPGLATSADDAGFTLLHIAATSGQVDIIAYLLNRGANIEARTAGGQTPLFQTVPLVSRQAFEYLLDKGANLHARDNDGKTILQFALSWQRPAMVDVILKSGFTLDARDAGDEEMLDQACNAGIETLVNALTAAGVPASCAKRNGTTLLHSAARGGLADFIRRLVTQNPRLEERDQHGLTPLHVAAFYGRNEAVRILLEAGADIDARGYDGRSAVHLAQYGRHAGTVALLLSKGAKASPPALPRLKRPYLGQPLPGSTPRIFAPGIVSSEEHETNLSFAPDGRELCLSRINADQTSRWLLIMRFQDGRWTEPQPVPFATGTDFEGAYSTDGRKLFFASSRPLQKGDPTKRDTDIWVVERLDVGWSEPRNLGPAINGQSNEFMPSVDSKGNLYFERYGLNMASWRDGDYLPAQKTAATISNVANLGHPFIAPDGSYLLFDARPPGGANKPVLFASYLMKDGTWSQAVRLFDRADTREYESCPTVSPDGKFLFFGRDHDIYWASAAIIKALRPRDPLP